MRHAAKRDAWITCLIYGYALVSFAGGVVFLAMGQPVTLAAGVLCLATGLLFLACLYATTYEITDRHLIARSGPFRRSVPLEEIQKAEALERVGYVFFAGWRGFRFALSSSIVVVHHARNHGPRWLLVISPADADDFLADLKKATELPSTAEGTLEGEPKSAA